MIYPGEFVYVPSHKFVGMYLGYDEPNNKYLPPNLYVYGEGPEGLDVYIYEPKEVTHIIAPDETALTKQAIFKTPYMKYDFDYTFNKQFVEDTSDEILKEINGLLRKKWFKAKYEVVKVKQTTTKEKA